MYSYKLSRSLAICGKNFFLLQCKAFRLESAMKAKPVPMKAINRYMVQFGGHSDRFVIFNVLRRIHLYPNKQVATYDLKRMAELCGWRYEIIWLLKKTITIVFTDLRDFWNPPRNRSQRRDSGNEWRRISQPKGTVRDQQAIGM